jgi:hypothetical protein
MHETSSKIAVLAAQFHELTDAAIATSNTPDGNRALDLLCRQSDEMMTRLAVMPATILVDLAERGRAMMNPGMWRSIARDVQNLANLPGAPDPRWPSLARRQRHERAPAKLTTERKRQIPCSAWGIRFGKRVARPRDAAGNCRSVRLGSRRDQQTGTRNAQHIAR